ncbi:MAG: RsmE family RNA methyltransferase [Actinomycetota bacterium]
MPASSGPALPLADRNLPFVLVDDLSAPALSDHDLHHYRRVRRLSDGQPVVVGDGRGGWLPARFATNPEPTGEVTVVAAPTPAITVGFVPVKAAKPEWVATKLTELGVDEIVPIVSEHSVVRWDDARAAKVVERMIVAVREATQQSRRLHQPRVAPAASLVDFIRDAPHAVLADPDGAPMPPATATIVVGPEGGFSDTERAARACVALPGAVMRAETAAVVAGSMLVGLRSGVLGVGGPPTPGSTG